MIRVNKKIRRHEFSSCNCHISWNRFLSVPVKLRPVTLPEPVFVDGRMYQVKNQLPIWMRLQISKYMELLIKVPNLGNYEVA